MRYALHAARAAIGVAFLALSAQAVAAETLDFDVFRNGKPFGRHTLTIQHQGDATLVKSNVSMEAKVGPFVAFLYRSKCSERWVGETMQTISCTTLKDGKTRTVEAVREGGKLDIAVNGKAVKAGSASLVPVSAWNMAVIGDSQTLSTDDGKILPLKVTDLGAESVRVAGKNVDTRRYRFQSSLTLDSWYDAAGRWVKAVFKARGQTIEYRARPAG
jgi:hypothetical protein